MTINLADACRTRFDLCIVGSGPAGIIVALETTRLNPDWRILLVEFGRLEGMGKNRLDDSIRVTNLINHHPPYECTNKGLGGTSRTWGGRCVMYDEIDFLPRPILQGQCTWDVSFLAGVRGHVPRAADYFQCGRGPFDLKELPELHRGPIAEGFGSEIISDTALERWSMPTRFQRRYGAELAASGKIYILSGCRVVSVASPDTSGRVTGVVAEPTDGGAPIQLKARWLVLAAGAQETTRILLKSPGLFIRRGGPPFALGRYYQGHVSGKIARIRFHGHPRTTQYGFIRDRAGVFLRRRFQFNRGFLVRENLLNTAFWLDNPPYFDPAHRNGTCSFLYLAMITPGLGRWLAPPAVAASITKGKRFKVLSHLWNVAKDSPASLWLPLVTFIRRYCFSRQLPGVFFYNERNEYALHFHAEQIPDPSNRMELGADNDELIIHYRLGAAELDSVVRCHDWLEHELRASNSGILTYAFPREQLPQALDNMSRDGIHQSGTTRISQRAEDGVVDYNLKIWGVENVFVCSSSAFPTSSQANPTFFLGACAVRLADHLRDHAIY
ncbi:MAG: GMC oxidoreductase [Verrucomicrobiales bacterium]|nr:GMC oxidoreductase [Verrucomicrobiales bacterium]